MDSSGPAPPAPSPAPPPTPTATATATATATPTASHKLRLMCSYGGHIVPRPMDKTLCYAGGETRIVAVEKRTASSLSSLTSHLSKSLLDGRQFSLKYQLPNHDLDSLISVSTDEDLANMIEEYDRLASSPSRLRFFLFPARSAGDSDLHDPTSEDWFIDALRNVGVVTKERSSDSESEGKVAPASGGGRPLIDSGTSLPESIILEKNSSFGSTSSSASASNSPAIRSGGGGGGEEGAGIRLPDFKAAMPLIDSISSDSSLASQLFSPQGIVYQDASGFNESKTPTNLLETESNVSDRSPRADLLTPVQVSSYMLSRPMGQQQQQELQPSQSSAAPQPPPHQYIQLASQPHYVTQYYPTPVPVASYPPMYQPYVQTHQPVQYQMNTQYGYPVYMMPVGQGHNPSDISMQSTMATAQNNAHGHAQVPSNPVMVASHMYYDGYKPAPPTPEYATNMYGMPAVASQVVNLPSDDHPRQPQMAPNPVMISSQAVYDGRRPSSPVPEYAAKVYMTSTVATQPVSMPSDDHHQKGAQFPPPNQPTQPVASAALENPSYINEYEDHMHAQIYKTQPPAPTLPSKLQPATNAAKVMLSETFAQLHVDNTTKH